MRQTHHKKQKNLLILAIVSLVGYVVEGRTRHFACRPRTFLDTLINRMAFLIAALQVDGGSEFAANLNKPVSNEANHSS